MPKGKLTELGWILIYSILAVVAVISMAAIGYRWLTREEPNPVVIEEVAPGPPPIMIDVEGVGCVMKPEIRFDIRTGYTLITLEGDTDLLYHFLPAFDPEE